MNDIKLKQCYRCRKVKSHEQFGDHPQASDGKQSNCKQCAVEQQRERRARQKTHDYSLCQLMRNWGRSNG